MLNFIKNISPTEIIILAVILILLFGGKAFISIARTAGESFKEIKKVKKNINEVVGTDDKKSKS
jgi:sec-independent protein translocase protein TatA